MKRTLEESQEVIRRAISRVCSLHGEPGSQKQLLAWLLTETPNIVDDENAPDQATRHDARIEDMVLRLPNELLGVVRADFLGESRMMPLSPPPR